MDVKSKADFINSVASGEQKPCPNCNTLNKINAKFCVKCGSQLPAAEQTALSQGEAAFAPAAPEQKKPENTAASVAESAKATPFASVEFEPEQEEAKSVLAEGLPSWNIDPPQVMVRRKSAK